MRLYKEWFVKLRFPGYENTKIVDGVPEGWRLGRVSELAEFKRGKTITKKNAKDGNVPVVAGGLEPAYFHNVANTVAPVITISASGANAGYTRLYNTDIWASDCSYIDASYGDKLYFIYTFLKNNKEVIDNLQRGAAQPHVYAKDINALSTYIPESTIMEPFCNLVAPLFKKIAVQERLISELKQARDKLLPKLMSGEIEV
jgi:type I restriction enzyme S subunit